MEINTFLTLKTFDDFKNIGIKLTQIKDLPLWYYNNLIIPASYNMFPSYCKMVNEYRMRYIELDFEDGDTVSFIFKVIQIVQVKQIKLFEVPFSKNNNFKHIKLVVEYMSSILGKQFVIFSNIYKCGIIDPMSCNYYYNYDYFSKKITRDFCKNHHFNRYKNNFSLNIFTTLNNKNKETFISIYNQWHDNKKNPKSSASFMHALKVEDKNFLYYIGTLKDIPCICGIGILTKFGLYIIYEYSLNRTSSLYNSIVLYTSIILSQKLYNEYNIYNIYTLGARDNNKGLIDFKERTSEGKIESYKINIKELLELYDKT